MNSRVVINREVAGRSDIEKRKVWEAVVPKPIAAAFAPINKAHDRD